MSNDGTSQAILTNPVPSVRSGASTVAVETNEQDFAAVHRQNRVFIVDFGSQTTQLIARRVRELHVYCEIHPATAPDLVSRAQLFAPAAIILSGGPASVHAEGSPQLEPDLLTLGAPVLGICYGMQAMVQLAGGHVKPANHREFGSALVDIQEKHPILPEIYQQQGARWPVWMSHGDQVYPETLPSSFRIIGSTPTCPCAIIADDECCFYGVQFHPEVSHTTHGLDFLQSFLFQICNITPSWQMDTWIEETITQIRHDVGQDQVLLALSGGVDSSVAAALIHRAIGEQLICVHVDHGLQRQDEVTEIKQLFANAFGMQLIVVDAATQFLSALRGVTDPEKKRKAIGKLFVEIFEEKARDLTLRSYQSTSSRVAWLAQGTLYPDVVESVSAHGGPSAVIKSHHNVGGLPENMQLKLLEPLRQLFKDEVRVIGKALGLPDDVLWRQPFPGPGLAIRILGEVTEERCQILRAADQIVRDEIKKAIDADHNLHLWQWFAVLLPVRSVGVMGDARTYDETIAIRCIESQDGMTADVAELPWPLLKKISNRILNEVRGINRAVYDISSKPPATIEWE